MLYRDYLRHPAISLGSVYRPIEGCPKYCSRCASLALDKQALDNKSVQADFLQA